MNKNAIIIISIGAAAFLTALFYIYFSNPKATNTTEQNPQTQQADPMLEGIERQTEKVLRSGVNQNEIVYKISQGEATYGANKQYFGKDAEEIVGKTSKVEGTGFWNKTNNEIEVSASVDLSSLMTNNPKRDNDIQPLFTNKVATFRIDPTMVDIKMGEQFEKEMTGNMTLNGVSKPVAFKTKGIITDTNFSIEGDTTIKMSDFGITAPNLINVFTVKDELPITFKISGESVSTVNNE